MVARLAQAGVHSLWLNSDGVCQPLQLNDDTGLKYASSLQSACIVVTRSEY